MKLMKFIAGIDEAGRGPVIGPMVIAGVLVEESRIPELVDMGVRDSKKLTPRRREILRSTIMETVKVHRIEILEAAVIDDTRRVKSLNRLEAEVMARILDGLRPDLAQIGSVDVIPSRFKEMVLSGMRSPTEIQSTHHAEDLFPAVAAASIIAKTTRDRIVASMRQEFGDFGSGYPSDPKTRAFISEWYVSKRTLPHIVRKSWKTVESITRGIDSERHTLRERIGHSSLR
jgi:ribonuclease HII